jgi:hypothetical protein
MNCSNVGLTFSALMARIEASEWWMTARCRHNETHVCASYCIVTSQTGHCMEPWYENNMNVITKQR